MSSSSPELSGEEPRPTPERQAGRPRIRDLEELDRRQKQALQRYETQSRIVRALLVLVAVAGVVMLLAVRSNLNTDLARASGELDRLRTLVELKAGTCRRYVADDEASIPTLSRLVEAEHQLRSPDLPTRVRGYREYNRLTRSVCSRSATLARRDRYSLFNELSGGLKSTDRQLKKGAQTFNQRAKTYNLAIQRFPASATRGLMGLPEQLPYITD